MSAVLLRSKVRSDLRESTRPHTAAREERISRASDGLTCAAADPSGLVPSSQHRNLNNQKSSSESQISRSPSCAGWNRGPSEGRACATATSSRCRTRRSLQIKSLPLHLDALRLPCPKNGHGKKVFSLPTLLSDAMTQAEKQRRCFNFLHKCHQSSVKTEKHLKNDGVWIHEVGSHCYPLVHFSYVQT